MLLLDLEWKVVYVGNAEDRHDDQMLEEVMVGPVPVGINRFVLQASAPDPDKIPQEDLIGVTVVLVQCCYMDNMFVQIGYYVNNEYTEPYEPDCPPNPVDIRKLHRNILADQPRVTRFPIDWTGSNAAVAATTAFDAENAAAGQVAEDGDDILNMGDGIGDDDDDEEDDEDDDIDGEVDLGEEDDELEEEEDEGEFSEDGEDELVSDENYNGQMEVLNEDSNSMDVNRMFQQQQGQ